MKAFSTFSKYLAWISLFSSNVIFAGSPLWVFTPLTATEITLAANSTATVQYIVTNQSSRTHTLTLKPQAGLTQITNGQGICPNPFILAKNASCTLSIEIDGSQLKQSFSSGPVVCSSASSFQCYQPTSANVLRVILEASSSMATIMVSGSPLTLLTNGQASALTIMNYSLVTATNIMSNFTGTGLDGNVTESGNTCSTLAPQSSCTLTYVPGSISVPQTNFTIEGSNTNVLTAAIQIDASPSLSNIAPNAGSASGGDGVTLTGTILTGTTSVTFGGVAATSVNVINSTTVTAVTPTHAAGAVDVVITTPGGNATVINGYTYQTTAVGQTAFGGIIGCLNGGLNNLITTTADTSTSIDWGQSGVSTNASSDTDGDTNTALIVNVLGSSTANASTLCSDYEIDSQGNTPCQSGNTCYNDWFLPAGNNATPTGQLNCIYTNRLALTGFSNAAYWSSTENTSTTSWSQHFGSGISSAASKAVGLHVRCVRTFTP